MDQSLPQRINRARELLATVHHAAMATVNEDGSPHNTPFLLAADPELKFIYWASQAEAMHSKNILRTGQLFVVLFEATARGGLYLEGANGHVLTRGEIDRGLQAHNLARQRSGQPTLTLEEYGSVQPTKLWGAELARFWVNASEKDERGNYLRDYRREIRREELID